jgi:hypothetical protein
LRVSLAAEELEGGLDVLQVVLEEAAVPGIG